MFNGMRLRRNKWQLRSGLATYSCVVLALLLVGGTVQSVSQTGVDAPTSGKFMYADLQRNEIDGLFSLKYLLGSNQQQMTAIISTEDMVTKVVSSECSQRCEVPEKYEFANSITATEEKGKSSNQLELYKQGFIGIDHYTGSYVKDNIDVDNSAEVKTVFPIDLQTIKSTVLTFSSSYSSYIGLAPRSTDHTNKHEGFLYWAQQYGMINHKVFALYANQDDTVKSSIKFGSYDPNGIASGSQLTYMKTASPDTWGIKAKGLKLAQSEVNLTSSAQKQALVQPLLPFMYIPRDEFNSFKEVVLAKFEKRGLLCTHSHCFFDKTCDEVLPNIENDLVLDIELQDGTLQIQAERLVVSAKKLHLHHQRCYLAVFMHKELDQNTWYLGSQTMADFYTVFDMTPLDEKSKDFIQVGFAKLNAAGLTQEKHPKPPPPPKHEEHKDQPEEPKDQPEEPKEEPQDHHDQDEEQKPSEHKEEPKKDKKDKPIHKKEVQPPKENDSPSILDTIKKYSMEFLHLMNQFYHMLMNDFQFIMKYI